MKPATFLAALSALIDRQREHYTEIEMLALVTAWCMVQTNEMGEDEYDALARRAADIAVRLGPVPERLN